jgi:Mn-dependent DtxR family transcriptional regulator
MFGWRKKDSISLEAELREATLKRLAEVLGLPEEDFEVREAPKQAAPKTALELNTRRELSGVC